MNHAHQHTATLDARTLPRAYSPSAATAQTLWLQLLETLHAWRHLSRSRRELLELDAHMLKDIGISRSQVVAESDKPFWRA